MSEKENFYYMGGTNGVGKTTFERKLLDNYPEQFRIVHGAAALMKQLGLADGDYTGLRAIARAQKAEAFSDLVFDLAKDTDGRSKIIATHFAVMTTGQIEFNKDEPWLKNVDALVLLKARMEDMMQRIKDDIRDRKLFPDQCSEEEMLGLLRAFVWRSTKQFNFLSKKHNKPSIVIQNNNGQLDQAVNIFYSAHRILLNQSKTNFYIKKIN